MPVHIAIRRAGRKGWDFAAVSGLEDSIPFWAAQQGIAPGMLRIIAVTDGPDTTRPPGPSPTISAYGLKRKGWVHSWKMDSWMPMEEPFPIAMAGVLQRVRVSMTLETVMFGAIEFTLVVGDEIIRLCLDDVNDNPPEFVVRFVQILQAGGQPSAYLLCNGNCFVGIRDYEGDDCLLVIDGCASDDRPTHRQVIVGRDELVSAFKGLFAQIADHPWYTSHFYGSGCVDSDIYDAIDRQAETDWLDGVRRGLWPDDWAMEREFTARRIAEGISCSERMQASAALECEMWRNLAIPEQSERELHLPPVPAKGTK